MEKIKVLVIPSDTKGGVGFYRSIQPHIQLERMFPDEFSVDIQPEPNFNYLSTFDRYDIIHVHKGLFNDMQLFHNMIDHCQERDVKVVLDLDDHWKLDQSHPSYMSNRRLGINKIIASNIKKADYVTTTTELFADEIKKVNKQVKVLPNAIDPDDERFKVTKTQSDRLRFGFVMGSSHENDLKLMDGFVKLLSKDTLEKIQIVLCGFDTRGRMGFIDQNTGTITYRNIEPSESVWARYETMVTDNYSIVNPAYKQFLLTYAQNTDWPDTNDVYRRCWTKDIDHYFQHYENVDVLLVPLVKNEFNKMKSPLKIIECGFSDTAIIASDFGPYQIDLVNAIERGGKINQEGNALLVEQEKGHKQWAKYIERLVKDRDLLNMIKRNLHNTVKDKYNLQNVTRDRAEFYRNIVKK